MDNYVQLLQMGCFTREDVAKMSGNVRTADSILYSHKQKGLIVSVKRNLYAAISVETNQPISSPYEIASRITENSYISHHSAFEYHGMANQVFSDVYVSSKNKFADFDFDSRTYKWVCSKTELGIKSPTAKIRITDIERTIVDSIKDFTKIGGLEELLRCLTMITYADEVKLLSYLSSYNNQFLYQKTGYILSHYKNMKLSDSFFETCKIKIINSVRYLFDEIKFENSVLSQKWRIYVPVDLMKLTDEGGKEIV